MVLSVLSHCRQRRLPVAVAAAADSAAAAVVDAVVAAVVDAAVAVTDRLQLFPSHLHLQLSSTPLNRIFVLFLDVGGGRCTEERVALGALLLEALVGDAHAEGGAVVGGEEAVAAASPHAVGEVVAGATLGLQEDAAAALAWGYLEAGATAARLASSGDHRWGQGQLEG